MVRIIAQNISEDTLKKYYIEYMSRGTNVDDSDSCEICNLPKLFHIDDRGEIILGPCDKYTTSDYIEIWKIFRHKIRPIRKWHNEILEKRKEDKIKYLNGFTTLTEDIINGDKNLEDLQNYISKIGDIELEANESQKVMGIVRLIISQFIEASSNDSELGTDGRMSRTQPNESKPEGDHIEKDRKEQEINSKCSHCNREFDNLKDFRMHENNCHPCEQCNNWYESREDLENHKRKRHKEYNDEQINNYQEDRKHLNYHKDEINLKNSKDNIEGKKEIEKQKNENHRYEHECDLCKKQFRERNELVEH